MIRSALCTLLRLMGITLLASCSPAHTTSTPVPNLPNPAAVYCEQHGGRQEIVTAADSSQTGLCLFPDDSTCDEWAYFRGECKPGDSLVMPGPIVTPMPVSTSATASPAPTVTPVPTAALLPTAVPDSAVTPVSVPVTPAGRPAADSRAVIEAIREFMGSPELSVTYIGTGTHSENSSMAVEEYESIDATFMVEQQSKLVVYMQKKKWEPSTGTALSGDELERIIRTFLAAKNPCFGAAEDLLKFTSSGKVGNRFFRWQSLHPDADRPLDQPVFIQVGISADGTIFGYVDSGICELAQNRPAHVTPIPTDTPTPAPEPQCQLAVTTAASKHSGWVQCTNVRYGFSFQYPPDWPLQEIVDPIDTSYGHAVYLTPLTDPSVRMIIAFKRADEDRPITPTGIGGGELVTRGGVSLLGQAVERIVRVELGKDMAVYYGWPRSAPTGGDLGFWLALDCGCSAGNPAAAGLTPEVEQIADAIVESIEVK